MAWSEVAEVFGTSWGVVYRAVASVVAWGLAVRRLDNVRAIGVDEIAVRKGQHYLTVVYQLDEGVRRLLWVGKERTEKTFEGFFEMLGEEQSKALDYIASDMWKPYLKVIAKHAAQAAEILTPVAGEAWPAAHWVQWEAPDDGWKVPAPQFVQARAAAPE
jgi:transposase